MGATGVTLIIAKKIAGEVFLLADTLLTDPVLIRQKWHLITPKILNFDRIAVAFSGVIEPILKEWGRLPSDITLSEMISECETMVVRYGRHIDFIIVDFQNCSLTKVSEELCQDIDQGWIGNFEAFEKFQSYFHESKLRESNLMSNSSLGITYSPSKNPMFNEIYHKSHNAFLKLLSSTDFYVGGFLVPFVLTNDSARYGMYAKSHSSTTALSGALKEKANTWIDVDFEIRSPNSGSFSYEFLGTTSGYIINIPQIMKQTGWHSPFVERVEPSGSFFGLSKKIRGYPK